jgi:ATP-dependent helicase HrpA
MLTHDTAAEVRAQDFPTQWHDSDEAGLTFPISYHFEPGATDDGLTIDVPVATLNRIDADDFSWLVPGLREELVTELIRSLPKNLRVAMVPAPNTAREFLAATPPGAEPLLDALERFARSTRSLLIDRGAWDWSKVPAHLRPTYRVLTEEGAEAGRGKDLDALKEPLRPTFEQAMADVAADSGVTATGQTRWTFGTIDESFVQRRAGHEVRGFPALVDEGTSVGLQVMATPDEAAAHHRLGVRRLVLLALGPSPSVDDVLAAAGLAQRARLALVGSPYPSGGDLVEDVRAALVGEVVDARPAVRDEAAYDAVVAVARDAVAGGTGAAVHDVMLVLEAWRATDKAISGRADLATLPALTDMRAQVGRLMAPGFIGEAGVSRLRDVARYLTAVTHRRERLDAQVARDRQLMDQLSGLQEAWLHAVAALPEGQPMPQHLRDSRWLLEEYRVSLFAQQLGTREKVSDQRIRKVMGTAVQRP